MKLENHSGIVDNYRFPKGDPEVMARYNAPLYLAVKMNRKVVSTGDTTLVDTYIVNEKNLKGSYILNLVAKDESGNVVASHKERVTVKGGNDYGQCLQSGWAFIPKSKGYTEYERHHNTGQCSRYDGSSGKLLTWCRHGGSGLQRWHP